MIVKEFCSVLSDFILLFIQEDAYSFSWGIARRRIKSILAQRPLWIKNSLETIIETIIYYNIHCCLHLVHFGVGS